MTVQGVCMPVQGGCMPVQGCFMAVQGGYMPVQKGYMAVQVSCKLGGLCARDALIPIQKISASDFYSFLLSEAGAGAAEVVSAPMTPKVCSIESP